MTLDIIPIMIRRPEWNIVIKDHIAPGTNISIVCLQMNNQFMARHLTWQRLAVNLVQPRMNLCTSEPVRASIDNISKRAKKKKQNVLANWSFYSIKIRWSSRSQQIGFWYGSENRFLRLINIILQHSFYLIFDIEDQDTITCMLTIVKRYHT